MKKDVIIKWVGSKRKQAPTIISYFPDKINTYYEPFLGSGAVFRELLDSDIKVEKYVCSDICEELISIWNLVKDDPWTLLNEYTKRFDIMMSKQGKQRDEYYYNIRYKYNNESNNYQDKIHDFYYLMRSCFNGLPRWNSKNEFNAAFSVKKKGADPQKLEKTIIETHNILKNVDVEFRCCSFDEISPQYGDLVYMDPPYATLCSSLYMNQLNPTKFFDYCRNLRMHNIDYLFSYDGISGNMNYEYDVPKDIYDDHVYVESFNSGFKSMQKLKNNKVFDSLYISMNQ